MGRRPTRARKMSFLRCATARPAVYVFIVRVNSLVVGIFHSTGQICFWGIQNTLYSNADTVTPIIQTARTRPCDTVTGCAPSSKNFPRPYFKLPVQMTGGRVSR